jgi:hypothetical protein
MVERSVPEEPTPASLATAPGLAWLDRVLQRSVPPGVSLLHVYRELSPEDARRLALTLIDQQAQWKAKSLLPQGGCGHNIDDIIPIVLAQLAAFCGPLPRPILEEARAAGIKYPFGIFRGSESLVNDHAFPDEVGYLHEGVELVRCPTIDPPPVSARAGSGGFVYLDASAHPLVLLLDVHLTSPDMSFLKLNGTRLRVCGWADPVDKPCFTKVGLAGEVNLCEGPAAPAPNPRYQPNRATSVPGRKLISPFEGLREAGYLGTRIRIGGAPEWEQDPEVPLSPADGKPMTFIGQFPDPVDGSTAYVFLDYQHFIACVVHQMS